MAPWPPPREPDARSVARGESHRAARRVLRWKATLGIAAFLAMATVVAGATAWAGLGADLALAIGGAVGIWTGTPIGVRLGVWVAARLSGSDPSPP
jgi:hypothetical protein